MEVNITIWVKIKLNFLQYYKQSENINILTMMCGRYKEKKYINLLKQNYKF